MKECIGFMTPNITNVKDECDVKYSSRSITLDAMMQLRKTQKSVLPTMPRIHQVEPFSYSSKFSECLSLLPIYIYAESIFMRNLKYVPKL